MKIRINLLFIIVLSLSTLVSHATTRTINVSQLTGNLVAALRTQVAGLTYTDKVILNFDKAGTYQMNGSVDFPCSVEAPSLLDNIYCEGSQAVKSNTFLP